MIWVQPHFEELLMNAEIGAYQSEDETGERPEHEPFFEAVTQAPQAAARPDTPRG